MFTAPLPARRSMARIAAAAMVFSVTLSACAGGGDTPDSDFDGEIVFGFLQPDSGPNANPQIEPALTAAEAYINGELGGIQGKRVVFEVCNSDESPARVIGCANDMASKGVVAVIDGYDRGSASAMPVLKEAGIPIVGNIAQSTEADSDTTGTYTALSGSNGAIAIAPLQAFYEQGYRNLALSFADVPALHDYAERFLAPVAAELGMSFTAVYFDPASPNFNVLAANLIQGEPDMAGVAVLPNPGQCGQFVKAMKDSGWTGPIVAGTCVDIGEELGGDAVGTQVYSSVWVPGMAQYAPAAIADQLEITEKYLAETGSDTIGYFSYGTFATIMDAVSIAGSIDGDITSQAYSEAVASLSDYQGWIGPVLTCDGTAWPNSSACSAQIITGIVQPDGSLEPFNGGFNTADAGLLPS